MHMSSQACSGQAQARTAVQNDMHGMALLHSVMCVVLLHPTSRAGACQGG